MTVQHSTMQNTDVGGRAVKYSSVRPVYNSTLQTGQMTQLIINQPPIIQNDIQQARPLRPNSIQQLQTHQLHQQKKGKSDRKHITVQDPKRRGGETIYKQQ